MAYEGQWEENIKLRKVNFLEEKHLNKFRSRVPTGLKITHSLKMTVKKWNCEKCKTFEQDFLITFSLGKFSVWNNINFTLGQVHSHSSAHISIATSLKWHIDIKIDGSTGEFLIMIDNVNLWVERSSATIPRGEIVISRNHPKRKAWRCCAVTGVDILVEIAIEIYWQMPYQITSIRKLRSLLKSSIQGSTENAIEQKNNRWKKQNPGSPKESKKRFYAVNVAWRTQNRIKSEFSVAIFNNSQVKLPSVFAL